MKCLRTCRLHFFPPVPRHGGLHLSVLHNVRGLGKSQYLNIVWRPSYHHNTRISIMGDPKISTSIYPPPLIPTDISLSQFLKRYNPDAVDGNKIILQDDRTERGRSGLSYDEVRDVGGLARRLRSEFGIGVGETVAISGLNSVSCSPASHYGGNQ